MLRDAEAEPTEIVAVVSCCTRVVWTTKLPVAETTAGTIAAGLLEDAPIYTVDPLAGVGVTVSIPSTVPPPVTVEGDRDTLVTVTWVGAAVTARSVPILPL